MNENILTILKKDIKNADTAFKNSEERKNLKLWVHSKIKRKIITKVGTLNVTLTKYTYKKNGKIKTYIFDKHFILENINYKNIHYDLEKEVVEDFLNGYSYRANSEKHNISVSTIHKIIKNSELKNNQLINYKNEVNKTTKILYICVDDTFHKYYTFKNKKQKIKFKMINFFMLTNNKKIVNKNHLIIATDSDLNYPINILASKLIEIKNKCYGGDLQVIVTGDGASWIKNLAHKVNAKYILCRFHIRQKFNVIFNNSKELTISMKKFEEIHGFNLRNKLLNLFYNEEYNKFLSIIERYKEELKELWNINRYNLFENFYKYIKNNLSGLTDIYYNDSAYFGNVAESFVSHLIKKPIKRSWAIFGIKPLMLMITKSKKIYLENYCL